MNRLLTTLAITVLINSVSVAHATAQLRSAAQHAEPAQIIDGPTAPALVCRTLSSSSPPPARASAS